MWSAEFGKHGELFALLGRKRVRVEWCKKIGVVLGCDKRKYRSR